MIDHNHSAMKETSALHSAIRRKTELTYGQISPLRFSFTSARFPIAFFAPSPSPSYIFYFFSTARASRVEPIPSLLQLESTNNFYRKWMTFDV
jgi:hypothetical protein